MNYHAEKRILAGSSPGVGGNELDDSMPEAGAAYVFVRDGAGEWSQHAYVKASNPDAGDGLGVSLALDGDTLVIGTEREMSSTTGVNPVPDNFQYSAGAVYVFR